MARCIRGRSYLQMRWCFRNSTLIHFISMSDKNTYALKLAFELAVITVLFKGIYGPEIYTVT